MGFTTSRFLAWAGRGTRPYFLLAALCLVLYLPGMSTLPATDRDESRYAQATRQMVESGDYVRIWYQDTPRNKKPVGIYWLQAACVHLFGDSGEREIWPHRIPSVAGAMLAVLATFFLGTVLVSRQKAVLGAVLMANCLLLVVVAHGATTDAVLVGTVTVAQAALARICLDKGRAPLWVAVVFWCAQGAGILVKGPITPMISALTVMVYWWRAREWSFLAGLRPLMGICLCLAIASPWFIAIHKATDGAFWRESVGRDLLGKVASGQESHGAPPGYYLLLVAFTFWPGSLWLVPSLFSAWRRRRELPVWFCLAWLLPTWLVFELVSTKLPHYVLPVYPALSMLVAMHLSEGPGRGRFERWLVAVLRVIWLFVAAVVLIGLPLIPVLLGSGVSFISVLAVLISVVSAWFIVGAWLRRATTATILAATAACILVLPLVFQTIVPSAEKLWLSRSIAAVMTKHYGDRESDMPQLAAAKYHEPSMVFLLGTETRLVSPEDAAQHVADQPNGVAVVRKRYDERFRNQADKLGVPVECFDELTGYNYTKGKSMTLLFYRKAGP